MDSTTAEHFPNTREAPVTITRDRRTQAPGRRPRARALLLAALVPAALATGALTATAANAAPVAAGSPADAQVSQPQFSRGFHVWNGGTHNLELKSVTGKYFDGLPPIGHVLPPKGTDDFEVTFMFFLNQQDQATYDILDDQGKSIGTYTADMTVLSGAGMPISGCSISVGRCTPNPPDGPENPGEAPYPLNVYDR